jgi:transposase
MTCTFSEGLKWRVVYLYHDGHSRENIAKLLHISKSTIDRVLQVYVKWGMVMNPWQKLPGRHKTLSRNEMKVLLFHTYTSTYSFPPLENFFRANIFFLCEK